MDIPSIAKFMSRRHGPRSDGWQAFLRNHTAHIAGIDLFVVPTIGFKLLYGLVILRLERRRLVWTDVHQIQPPSGSPDRSPKHSHGMRHRATSSVTATPRMAPGSPGGWKPRAFATGRSRHAHRGRTVMLNG